MFAISFFMDQTEKPTPDHQTPEDDRGPEHRLNLETSYPSIRVLFDQKTISEIQKAGGWERVFGF